MTDILTALLNGLLIAGTVFLLLFGEYIAARIRARRTASLMPRNDDLRDL